MDVFLHGVDNCSHQATLYLSLTRALFLPRRFYLKRCLLLVDKLHSVANERNLARTIVSTCMKERCSSGRDRTAAGLALRSRAQTYLRRNSQPWPSRGTQHEADRLMPVWVSKERRGTSAWSCTEAAVCLLPSSRERRLQQQNLSADSSEWVTIWMKEINWSATQ